MKLFSSTEKNVFNTLFNIRKYVNRFWRLRVIKKRKISLGLAIIFTILTIYLLFSISSFYEIQENKLLLTLIPDPDTNHIKSVKIWLQHDVNHDSLQIKVCFRNEFKDTSSFAIIYPNSIHYLRKICDFHYVKEWGSYTDHGKTTTQFKISPISNSTPYLTIELEGNILTGNSRESFFSFIIDLSKLLDCPIEVAFTGLNAVEVNNLSPKPDEFNEYYMKYVFIQQRPDIRMHLYDKKSVFKKEYWLFLIGVLIGVFVSFTTNVIFDIVREQEKE
ncbi:MAG: hypothetical protein WCK92_08020 [Bacteroidota bacterium]